MIRFRLYTKLLVLFIVTFIIFLTSSQLLRTATNELTEQAEIYDDNYDSTIETSITPIYTNLLSAFQIIFFILSVGIGLAVILVYIKGSEMYEDEL